MKLKINSINYESDGSIRNYSIEVLETDGTLILHKGMLGRFSFISAGPTLSAGLILDVTDPIPWEYCAPAERVKVCLPEESNVTK